MEFLNDAGKSLPIELRRRKGARHLKLTLGLRNQIVVSAPWRTSDRHVLHFLEAQRSWIDAQLADAPEVFTISEWLRLHPRVSVSGDILSVRVEVDPGARHGYSFDEGGSVLCLKPVGRDDASLLKLVREFARDALICRTYYHAKRVRVRIGRISVRDQSSRWGSCSASRCISLNWRLVLLEPCLQDYVILHELAHLSEMNHGPRFWSLLKSYDPDRLKHEQALDAVSSSIMRVGRLEAP
ncbi:MAG: M48 family metallopeptidase [Opitutales bacterium]